MESRRGPGRPPPKSIAQKAAGLEGYVRGTDHLRTEGVSALYAL
jgi:hypothetical protein